jgi:DNA repair protein RadC
VGLLPARPTGPVQAFAIIPLARASGLCWRNEIAVESVEYHVGLKDLPSNARPRERLLHVGADNLSDQELLAIVLRTGSQRANVLQLANDILARFGGLEALSKASVLDLCNHIGLGPAKAIQIQATFELGRRLVRLVPPERTLVRNPSDVAVLLMNKMTALEQEHLEVVLLNTKNRVLDHKEIVRGSLNSAAVRVGEIYREPVRQNAAAVILVHNHPSGDPTPSAEDVRLTVAAREAGELLDIELLDHLVFGGGTFVSLRERGLGFSRRAAER